MIIIPDIKTRIILPPKTASRSITQAVKRRYPNAIFKADHLEPTHALPPDWSSYCVVRDPGERLLSLYRYCQTVRWTGDPERAYEHRSVTNNISFESWLQSDFYFSPPWDTDQQRGTLMRIPDTRKSQVYWARPDLGTIVVPFRDLLWLSERLRLPLEDVNKATAPMPDYDKAFLRSWVETWFRWDYEVTC